MENIFKNMSNDEELAKQLLTMLDEAKSSVETKTREELPEIITFLKMMRSIILNESHKSFVGMMQTETEEDRTIYKEQIQLATMLSQLIEKINREIADEQNDKEISKSFKLVKEGDL